jgi:RNA polymerase sigma factor (sigma-70 family)
MDNPPPDATTGPISQHLVRRARQGDREAQDAVFREYTVPLSRLASRLLPSSVRAMTDTQDVVQDVLASTARRLGCIDCDDDGALLAYLRRAVRHRVVDEIRRVTRRPPMYELVDDRPAPDLSPLDAAIRAQNHRRSEAALCRLNARDRRAVILRLQHRLSYEEIGARLGSPTPNAARVTVRRAVERLTQVLAAAERRQESSRMRR